MSHVLIVEDDLPAARVLAHFLKAQGLDSSIVSNGLQVVPEVRRCEPALIVLDLMLPGRDGMDVCRDVREFSGVPILMLTARAEEIDRLLGLEVGADDYVCKPLSSPREVVARVKALLRRTQGQLVARASATFGFRVDDDALRIAWAEEWLPLTPLEFRLLKRLLAHPGHAFSRDALLSGIHDSTRDTTDRAIDTHVKNLRRKLLAAGAKTVSIRTVYSVGYRLDPL